jgi:hypothetical protein
MSSSFSDDQAQPDDTLDERGVDDVLDEGMSPPERPSRAVARGITAREDAEGETLEDRLEQEEDDPSTRIDYSAEDPGDDENADPSDDVEAGGERTGRLTQSDDGDDDLAEEVGIDGAAASAEEAAMHTIEDDLP